MKENDRNGEIDTAMEEGESAPRDWGLWAGRVARPGRARSMHEGIAVWCDCCTCEAEPYWVEAAESMGMDLGSDFEDA